MSESKRPKPIEDMHAAIASLDAQIQRERESGTHRVREVVAVKSIGEKR